PVGRSSVASVLENPVSPDTSPRTPHIVSRRLRLSLVNAHNVLRDQALGERPHATGAMFAGPLPKAHGWAYTRSLRAVRLQGGVQGWTRRWLAPDFSRVSTPKRSRPFPRRWSTSTSKR